MAIARALCAREQAALSRPRRTRSLIARNVLDQLDDLGLRRTGVATGMP
jgi:uncharacterized protein YjiS (DUF1127 family)